MLLPAICASVFSCGLSVANTAGTSSGDGASRKDVEGCNLLDLMIKGLKAETLHM